MWLAGFTAGAVVSLLVPMALIAGFAAQPMVTAQAAQQSRAGVPQDAVQDVPLPLPGGAAAQGSVIRDAVQFLYPAEVSVPARRSAEVDLNFRVADGLHINSHAPLDKTLVPARLAVLEGDGLNVTRVDFPQGVDYALALAPQHKLSVYTGNFILRAHLIATAGEHDLQAELRYQACDRNACLPPRKLPVTVRVIAK